MTSKDDIIERIDADRGVSPVIGVILMVAITVILAAVIGAFVMGMGQNVNENVNAGADVQVTNSSSPGGNVTVTWVSEGNAKNIQVSVKPKTTGASPENKTISSVGGSKTINELDIYSGAGAHKVQVVVTATGEDGETKTVVNNEEHTI
jgi:flagellin-like protein